MIFSGTYTTFDNFIQQPLYFTRGITNGYKINKNDYFYYPMQFMKYNSRILYIRRFWTEDNFSRKKGWIGPEGLTILINAIAHYAKTTPEGFVLDKVSGVYASFTGETYKISWNEIKDTEFYEIWHEIDGSNGTQAEWKSGGFSIGIFKNEFYRRGKLQI